MSKTEKLIEKLKAEKELATKMSKRNKQDVASNLRNIDLQKVVDKTSFANKDVIGYRSPKEASAEEGSFRKGGLIKGFPKLAKKGF